jgi:hypothetical protein
MKPKRLSLPEQRLLEKKAERDAADRDAVKSDKMKRIDRADAALAKWANRME